MQWTKQKYCETVPAARWDACTLFIGRICKMICLPFIFHWFMDDGQWMKKWWRLEACPAIRSCSPCNIQLHPNRGKCIHPTFHHDQRAKVSFSQPHSWPFLWCQEGEELLEASEGSVFCRMLGCNMIRATLAIAGTLFSFCWLSRDDDANWLLHIFGTAQLPSRLRECLMSRGTC